MQGSMVENSSENKYTYRESVFKGCLHLGEICLYFVMTDTPPSISTGHYDY